MRHRAGLAAAGCAAAAFGAVTAVALVGGSPAPAAPAAPPPATARVVRTDLATTVLTAATLGYSPAPPVVNQLSGTYTALPPPGGIVRDGGVLYRVDDDPVVLLGGGTPAWRPFGPGMSAGPDVLELEAALMRLGDARGLFTAPADVYDWRAMVAVERWQLSMGRPPTGSIALGEIVFEPAPVMVGAAGVALGEPAAAGQLPFAVTTTRRTVLVPIGPDTPVVRPGAAVWIVLPSGATTPGRVVAVEAAPAGAGGASGGASGGSDGNGGGGAAGASGGAGATEELVVTPLRPASTGTAAGLPVEVSLTTASVAGVLAVPITALLALAGGGYGVEVVRAGGRHVLVGVHTGLFTGDAVQVSGRGIAPGTRVVVAQ